ncbi:hypothetical protein [Halobacillus naozhouensis]|uniref:Uncharacterized protein n=1 Tax=Halobacillus naozhouensis TaxID=554880 RepID=A0ABY8IV19_9BACI|nr:hypothetical protein [Halobacillus naozhouensis]WFT73129.1 hypothetical protein P9989_11995 [Halobacillus naozhouensis]
MNEHQALACKLAEQEDSQNALEKEDVNVLELPPRYLVHTKQGPTRKQKHSKLWMRCLVLIFFIMVFAIVTYEYFGGEGLFHIEGADIPIYHKEIQIERHP